MNGWYNRVALYLNGLENHRKETNYEDALIGKTFIFQFVNSYMSLFYIAFLKNEVCRVRHRFVLCVVDTTAACLE
jgi:anoctamin-10/anoctamin-7